MRQPPVQQSKERQHGKLNERHRKCCRETIRTDRGVHPDGARRVPERNRRDAHGLQSGGTRQRVIRQWDRDSGTITKSASRDANVESRFGDVRRHDGASADHDDHERGLVQSR